MIRAARLVAAAALATAALVAHDDLGDTGDTGDSVGVVNAGSAVEEDLDAIDDADWDLL